MTATQATNTPTYQVGDRIQVQRQGRPTPGWISSIHRKDHGIAYVGRTDAADGDIAQVLSIWITSGQSCSLRSATGGETR